MATALTKDLAKFRKLESLEDLATVVDDANAIRLIASWPRIEIAWKKPRTQRPRASAPLWWWLWKGVSFDRAALASAAKVSEQAAHALVRMCASARVIYPDGSVSNDARKLISTHVETRMPGKRRGRPVGAKDAKKRKRKPKVKE